MLHFDGIFRNYEEFKQIFGIRTTYSGSKSRNNGILLSYLKEEFKNGKRDLCTKNLDQLYDLIMFKLMFFSYLHNSNVHLNGLTFGSPDYYTDSKSGVCDDGDCKSIRYVRISDGRTYKMKAGKFMRHLIMSCPATKDMSEQAVIWFCETFADKWKAYVMSLKPEYTLVVDDDFEAIYTKDRLRGEFNSCMSNKGFYQFYNDNVKAKAASIRDAKGLILARCVIFTEVYDMRTDKVYRLAERQYARDQDNSLKQILVDKLIEAGEIDGYKRIGADCHSTTAFLLNDGTTLHTDMYIDINAIYDSFPYMDSFKYYNDDEGRLYNFKADGCRYKLVYTDGSCEELDVDEGEWDEWHEQFCESTVFVNYYSIHSWRTCSCNEDDLDDFTMINGEYYETEHCYWSSYFNRYILEGNQVYSEYMGDYLPECEAIYKDDANDYFLDEDQYEEWLAEQEELVEVV